MSVAEIGFMVGLLCGIAGCVTIVLTDRADQRARRRASEAYWREWRHEMTIRRTCRSSAKRRRRRRKD